MLKWLEYDPENGEQIEFCCNQMKSVYGSLITWDAKEEKWAMKVDRWTMFQDPYTSKYITKKVEGVQDIKTIDYCMFCGKNMYKEELRYDTWISGSTMRICGDIFTGPKVYLCGNAVGWTGTVS